MKNRTKWLVVAGLALTAGIAIAAQYTASTLSISFAGAGLAAVTETNPATVVTLTKYEDVTIQVSGKLDDAGTDVTKVKFSRSVDGTTYETTPSMVMSLTHAGTTTTSCISNWNIGAVGYIKCVAISNAAATANLTNLVIKVTTKPARYGQ
jgi:hypothetical protein